MAKRSDRMETLVSLCKRRGIVFPSSEDLRRAARLLDYGPLGVEMKNNNQAPVVASMVQERDDIVGLDSSVILARECGRPAATSPSSSTRSPSASPATSDSVPIT